MTKATIPSLILSAILVSACNSSDSNNNGTINETSLDNNSAVSAVTITGEPANYTFSVTVQSPDTGCNQYADWWEVLRADGTLVYRRILTHSHVNDQPFTRSGGPVEVTANEAIIVRAHMNNMGYGEQVFSGSISEGLTMATIESSFREELAFVDPLPSDCAF